MNVLLLSAGKGERLFPLTEILPKCLLPMTSKGTMLNYWLELLVSLEVGQIFINIFWKKEEIIKYVSNLDETIRGKVQFYEEDFLEPVGSVLANLNRRCLGEEFIIIINSDTYIDPMKVKEFFDKSEVSLYFPICLGVSWQEDVQGKSFISTNPGNMINGFVEKPCLKCSGLVNAGILKMNCSVLHEFFLEDLKRRELSEGILLEFIGRMIAFDVGPIIDIGGSVEDYTKARSTL